MVDAAMQWLWIQVQREATRAYVPERKRTVMPALPSLPEKTIVYTLLFGRLRAHRLLVVRS